VGATFIQIYGNLLEQKNCLEKSSTPTGLVWNTNMAAGYIDVPKKQTP